MFSIKKKSFSFLLIGSILFSFLGNSRFILAKEEEKISNSLSAVRTKDIITSFLKKNENKEIKVTLFGECGHKRSILKTKEEDFMKGQRPKASSILYPAFYFWAGGYMLPYIFIIILYPLSMFFIHLFGPFLLFNWANYFLSKMLYFDHLFIGVLVLSAKMSLPIILIILEIFSPFYTPTQWMDIGENEFYECTLYLDRDQKLHIKDVYSFYKNVSDLQVYGRVVSSQKTDNFNELNDIAVLHTAPFFVGICENARYNERKIEMVNICDVLSLFRKDGQPLYGSKKNDFAGNDVSITIYPINLVDLQLDIDEEEDHLIFKEGRSLFRIKLENVNPNQMILLLTPINTMYKDVKYWRITLSIHSC